MAKKDKPPPPPPEAAAEQVNAASMAEALADYDGFVQAQAEEVWSYDELPFDLSLEEQLFVRSYVIDRNPVATMRRLGHRHEETQKLKARAQKHLNQGEVAAAIEYLAGRMMAKLQVTAEKVQAQMAAVAFFDPREIMTFDKYGVHLLHSRYWTREQATALQSVKQGQYGLELKFYDRMRATEMLAKQLGLNPDESDAATNARIAADESMARIAGIMSRLLPGGKHLVDQHFEERRTKDIKTIEHKP